MQTSPQPFFKRRPVLWEAANSLVEVSVPVGPGGNAYGREDAGAPGRPCWKEPPEGGGAGGGGREELGFKLVGEAWGWEAYKGGGMALAGLGGM